MTMGVLRRRTNGNERQSWTMLGNPAQQRLISHQLWRASRQHRSQRWCAPNDHQRLYGLVDLNGSGTDEIQGNGERFGNVSVVVNNQDQLRSARRGEPSRCQW
jgi:hypothetical protein